MKGLRKVCSETKGLHGYYSGEYLELFYDVQEDKVFTVYKYSLGQNSWTVFHDDTVIPCGVIDSPKTQEEIRTIVAAYIDAYFGGSAFKEALR